MPRQPPVEWVCATLPKAGHRPAENEDAAAVASDASRFAVCDGATEGWESRAWAKHLARAYALRAPAPDTFTDWLGQLRGGWTGSSEDSSTPAPRSTDRPVAWYAAEKQQQGSFATLLGLELRPSQGRPGEWAWKAVAIGDSCLVQVRGEDVEAAFPFATPEAFGSSPSLVPSSTDAACPEPEWLAGRAAPGDLLLLATDAAAARLVDPVALAPALAAVREALRDGKPAPLHTWFREVQSTANDDVTLVAIRLPAPEVS
jgi:hypothetical protein